MQVRMHVLEYGLITRYLGLYEKRRDFEGRGASLDSSVFEPEPPKLVEQIPDPEPRLDPRYEPRSEPSGIKKSIKRFRRGENGHKTETIEKVNPSSSTTAQKQAAINTNRPRLPRGGQFIQSELKTNSRPQKRPKQNYFEDYFPPGYFK